MNGDFSLLDGSKANGGCLASARQLKNSSGVPYPNNQIPQTQFDHTAASIANYLSTLLAPNRIVMDRVPGTRDMDEAADDDERRSIAEQYVAVLARMHSLVSFLPPISGPRHSGC